MSYYNESENYIIIQPCAADVLGDSIKNELNAFNAYTKYIRNIPSFAKFFTFCLRRRFASNENMLTFDYSKEFKKTLREFIEKVTICILNRSIDENEDRDDGYDEDTHDRDDQEEIHNNIYDIPQDNTSNGSQTEHPRRSSKLKRTLTLQAESSQTGLIFDLFLIHLHEAICVCHSAGIIHRDISYDNVLVNPDTGEIKLIDFSEAVCFTSVFDNQRPSFSRSSTGETVDGDDCQIGGRPSSIKYVNFSEEEVFQISEEDEGEYMRLCDRDFELLFDMCVAIIAYLKQLLGDFDVNDYGVILTQTADTIYNPFVTEEDLSDQSDGHSSRRYYSKKSLKLFLSILENTRQTYIDYFDELD